MHPPLRSPFSRGAALLLALALPLVLAAPASAGKRDYVDAIHGFEIKLPAKGEWSQTPTQPGEKIEVAKFKDDKKPQFSELSIFRFGVDGRDAQTTPGEDPEAEAPPIPQLPYGRQQPQNAEAYLDQLIGRTARFWGIEWEGLPAPDKKKFGKIEGDIYELEFEHAQRKGYRVGYVAGIVSNDDEEYLILFKTPGKLKKVLRDWTKSIRSFRFPEDGHTVDEKELEEELEDRNKTRKIDGELLDLEKRERVKADLKGTWRFIDTPRYLVIYNCDDNLAKYIAKRVEYMREYAFEKVFPPVAPIDECMIVRVCKEMNEYYHYGAPRGSAGYWSSGHDELVFPDLSQSKKPDSKTIGVMHHEAFHQYIHYALLKNSLPIWFNEGFAEYFYCIEGESKRKLKFAKRHEMRYGVVKSALGAGKLVPLKDFIKMNQPQYYARASLCYSQGWAFATWMKNVTKDERYSQVPDIMFREMQKGYLERQQGGGNQGFDPSSMRRMYGEYNDVVKAAMEKAFEGIDIAEMEKAFHKDLKRKM